jgi:ATP/ADP translocase
MNALTRFFSLGLQDADRRVAAALTPRPLGPVDRYLRGSAIVTAVDRATEMIDTWWRASVSGRIVNSWIERVSREAYPARYRAIASMLVIAVVVNTILNLMQGPRPGWFWMVVPAMTISFAALLFAGSRR